MQMWSMPPMANEVANKSIAIFGPGRTGTTLVSQLIHSADNVELAFEPPTLISLFAVGAEIPRHVLRTLTTTFLFEELVIGSLAGRYINMNRVDDSSAIRVLETSDILWRTEFSHRKRDLLERAGKAIPAFKIAGISSSFVTVLREFPSWQRVAVVRNPASTIESLLSKKWFARSSRNEVIDWPNFASSNGPQPYWMVSEDINSWMQKSEIERASLYLRRQLELIDAIEGVLIVNYDYLVQAPEIYINKIFEKLGLTFSDQTQRLLKGVKTRVLEKRITQDSSLNDRWLQTLSGSLGLD